MPECRVLTYLGNKRHCLCLSQGEKLIWTEYSGGMEEKESGIVILVWKRHWVRTEAEDNAVWLGCLCQMPGHGASVWGNLGIWAQGNSTSYQIREPRRDKMAFFFSFIFVCFQEGRRKYKNQFSVLNISKVYDTRSKWQCSPRHGIWGRGLNKSSQHKGDI